MKPTITVLTNGPPELYHCSKCWVALDALDRRGEIDLRFRETDGEDRPDTDPLTLNLLVDKKRVAIDLADHSDRFSRRVLRWCDSYFKRSYFRPHVHALAVEDAPKVAPFGLNYACRTAGSARRMLRRLRWKLSSIAVARQYLALPDVADFEQSPDMPLDPSITFQTRVWEAAEFPDGSDEPEVINQQRVALVRALREAFGERFHGGLVPTPLALRRYPRDVTAAATRRKAYTRQSKRHLVAIYTRGLFHSTGFKFAECLAASQCIVAEPPRNELPVPMRAGANYLPYWGPDECVAACSRLLADQDLARSMRHASHEYYLKHVEPVAHLRELLLR